MSSSKYAPLQVWFSMLPKDKYEVVLAFDEIEKILDFALPASARKYDAWWLDASRGTKHVQASAWLDTGWRVKTVKRSLQSVLFLRIQLQCT